MFRFVPLALLALISTPLAAPLDLDEDATVLFRCHIGAETSSDRVRLMAIEHDDGSWGPMQVMLEHDGKQTWIPADPVDPKANFFFSNSAGPEGYFARVRFAFDGTSYKLEMLDIPLDPADENDMGGRDASLTITDASGQSTELTCGETDEYVGYMQQAMGCDMTNPYGAAGCDFDVRPTRTPDDKLPARFSRQPILPPAAAAPKNPWRRSARSAWSPCRWTPGSRRYPCWSG